MAFPRSARMLLAGTVLIFLVHAACAAPAADRARQRVQFAAAYAAAKLGGDSWQSLARGLRDYPLYPYLEAAALRHDLGHANVTEVRAYLERYPGSVPAHDLRRDFLHQLAGREDWSNFRKLYRPGLGYALACDALKARLAAGETLDFDQDLSSIWAKVPLPSACDAIIDWAHQHDMLTLARLWNRVEEASRVGHAASIRKLSQWMHHGNGTVARRLILARQNPRKALQQADGWQDSPHTRMAVALAFERLAIADDEAAAAAWQKLRQRFAFSEAQAHAIEADIALFNATDFEADSLADLLALPAAAQTPGTRSWRVRVALTTGDWHKVQAALDALPDDMQRDAIWRYWRARTLAELGRKDEARKLFLGLARQATYYGFLAADWLGRPYAICPLQMQVDPGTVEQLLQHPGLARAFEFQALGMLPLARREWYYAMRNLDAGQRRQAAVLASQRGWYARAIFAFSSGNDMHRYQQRFPLAFRHKVVAEADSNQLDPAWVYAIIRAESAWVADAQSGADAYGLMQLLAPTGAEAAAALGLEWRGVSTLFNANVNITLGSWYLAQMAKRFHGSPWLASAAYNAGASKVEAWLAARDGLPPDVFIDTMPYHETRAYVHRVLAFSVIYDWVLNGKVTPMSARMPRPGHRYLPPSASSPRKQVACPALQKQPGQAAQD